MILKLRKKFFFFTLFFVMNTSLFAVMHPSKEEVSNSASIQPSSRILSQEKEAKSKPSLSKTPPQKKRTKTLFEIFEKLEPFGAIRYKTSLENLKGRSISDRFKEIDIPTSELSKHTTIISSTVLTFQNIPFHKNRKTKLLNGDTFELTIALDELEKIKAQNMKKETPMLHLLFTGLNGRLFFASSENGMAWSLDACIDEEANCSAGLTSLNNNLVMAFFNRTKKIRFSFSEDGGQTWQTPHINPNWASLHPPDLVTFKDKIYLIHLDQAPSKGFIYVSSSQNGREWLDPQTGKRNECMMLKNKNLIPLPWESGHSLRSTVFLNRLYLAHVGKTFFTDWVTNWAKGRIFLSFTEDGSTWTLAYQPNETWFTDYPVSLAAFRNKLFLAYISLDGNKLFISTSEDGKDWSNAYQPSVSWIASSLVSLSVFKDKLYLAYVEPRDNNILLSSSEDGLNWSPPYMPNNKWKTKFAVTLK